MKNYGFKRPIDKAGRLVICGELRKSYGIEPGELIELRPTDAGILLVPANMKEYAPNLEEKIAELQQDITEIKSVLRR